MKVYFIEFSYRNIIIVLILRE